MPKLISKVTGRACSNLLGFSRSSSANSSSFTSLVFSPPPFTTINLHDSNSNNSNNNNNIYNSFNNSICGYGYGGQYNQVRFMAVPKKKVSHRIQRRKLVRYDIKNISNIVTCKACGKPKLSHRLCENLELCAKGLKDHRASSSSSSSRKFSESESNEGNKK